MAPVGHTVTPMSAVQSDLPRRTAEMARIVHGEPTVALTAEVVVGLAVSLVSGCDAAGVSLVRKGRVRTVASSHDWCATGDRWQYEQGQGPCLEAMQPHEFLIESTDLRSEVRWPRWTPRVVDELGVRSMLSYRLFTSSSLVGALNLYSLTPDAFTTEDHAEGLILAGQAALALSSSEKIENLQLAVDRRTTIGQAQGLLMERFDLDSQQAFDVLVRLSRDSNSKLFDVAQSIVSTRRLPEQPVPQGS